MSDLLIQLQDKPGVNVLASDERKKHSSAWDVVAHKLSYSVWGDQEDKRAYIALNGDAVGWHGLTGILNITDVDFADSVELVAKADYGGANEALCLWSLDDINMPAGVKTALETDGYAETTIAEIGVYIINKITAGTFNAVTNPQAIPHKYMFVSQTAVDNIDTTQAPQAAAWSAFQTLSATSLSLVATSVRDGGPTNCGGDVSRYCTTDRPTPRHDYEWVLIPMRDAIINCGVRYAFDGDANYYIKARDLIKHLTVDTNTRMEPFGSYPTSPYPIELYITITGILYASTFILDQWKIDEPANTATYQQWVSDFLASIKAGTNITQPYNKRCWYRTMWAACACVMGSQIELDAAIDHHKTQINQHIDNGTQGGPAGTIIGDRDRLTGDGLEGLGYSLYAIKAMMMLCEMARTNGIDLYSYTSGGRSIELALDTHAGYYLDVSTWVADGFEQADVAAYIQEGKALWELAYRHYGKASYLSCVNYAGRPIHDNRSLGPVTLTRGAA